MELEKTSSSLEAAALRWQRFNGRGETYRAGRVADEICAALVPLIAKLSSRFRERNPKASLSELEQQAKVAILGALQRYDAKAPANFHTFVQTAIEGSLQHYLRDDCGGIIKDPRNLYEKRPRVSRAEESLQERGEEPTFEALAAEAGIPIRDVERVQRTEATTQRTLRFGEGSAAGEINPDLIGGSEWLPGVETRLALLQPLAHLPHELREVIRLRFFESYTLKEAAEELGVTRECVRQREQKALARLRAVLQFADPLEAESPALRCLLTAENINRLPDPHRSILLDYYHEARSLTSIARTMGMTEDLVNDIRRRALETLRKQCQQQQDIFKRRELHKPNPEVTALLERNLKEKAATWRELTQAPAQNLKPKELEGTPNTQ